MIGSADGSGVPWSFSLMSFMAMENSNRSIFPSLFISARALEHKVEQNHYKTTKISVLKGMRRRSVYASHHISANTEAGRPDWRKNFLACSPTKPKEKKA